MDLRQLEYFLGIADAGSVTRAADALHVAQPSLSQALRSLERELGVRLFQRARQGMVLTSAGRALTGPARQVLRAVDAAHAAVREVQDLAGGRLDIVALPTLAVDPLATLAGAFRRAYPKVGMRVVEPSGARQVRELVQTGDCELGLTELRTAGEHLVMHELAVQEFCLVLPPGTEGVADPLPVGGLADIPMVASPSGTSSRDLLEHSMSALGVATRVAIETAHREAVVPLVLNGAGAALLPRARALEARRRGAVVVDVDPPPVRRIGIIHRMEDLSPAAAAFLALALPTSPSENGPTQEEPSQEGPRPAAASTAQATSG